MKRISLILLTVVTAIILSFTIKTRNTIHVLVDSYNRIYVEYQQIELSRLCDTLKLMIDNKDNSYMYPHKVEEQVDYFGNILVSKAVVSIANDRGTHYGYYIKVRNEIERAYHELREELALKKFKTHYKELSKDKRAAIDKIYPKVISEAEPILK